MSTMAVVESPAMNLALADALVAQLDFSMLRLKLRDAGEGPGWSDLDVDLYEREYRRFLVLNLMHPLESVVPCQSVDKFWHAHILDTAAYRVDCEKVFGQFFDHFPYFGLRGDADAQALDDAYERTLALYRHYFGEPPAGVWAPEDAMKCKRTACKPQKCRGQR
jgi:hypothetical protein